MIAAAGRSRRATTPDDQPKQLAELGGRPLWTWALDAVIEAGCSPIVVTAPPGLEDRFARSGVDVVAGGDTRQASVRAALGGLSTPLVVVHDGARPFATPALVKRVIAGLEEWDCVVPVQELDETVKEVKDGRVVRTIDRTLLHRAQTPQGFRTDLLREAHDAATAGGVFATDDAQLIEAIGGRVGTVIGERTNIKMTWPEDLRLAHAMLVALEPR